MKVKSQVQKAKTISEVCGLPVQAFQSLLAEKQTALKRMNERADRRVREALAREMVWAA